MHGFIGQETDIAIIVTGAQDGSRKTTDWLYASKPGNVAISRGKQGIIVIGNMNYLADDRAGTLGNFVRLAAQECPIIDGDYFLKTMRNCKGNPLIYRNYISNKSELLLYEREYVSPKMLIAKCELNDVNRWV